MNNKRIMLYGGPGSGKSTASHYVAWTLKNAGFSTEIAREWIKRPAYTMPKNDPRLDQRIVLGKQLDEELEALATGAIVVSDSPIRMQRCYTEDDILQGLVDNTADELDEKYPSIHIFIARDDSRFTQEGRFHSLEESKKLDKRILKILDYNYPGDSFRVQYGDWERLSRIVLDFAKGVSNSNP